MNHYPHHIGDFVKDTLGFNQGAIGAYRLLMDAYYANEEAPPAEDVYVIGRATTPAERKNVDRALTKFELRDGRYYHKRVEEELAAYRVRADSARENGKKGGRKPKEEPTANPQGTGERTEQEPKAEPKPNREKKLAISHKPENPNPPKESATVLETAQAPQPPSAPPHSPGWPAMDDARVQGLHGLCIAHRINARPLHAQQWVADGVTDEILRAAIERGHKRKNGQPFGVDWLQLMIADVRSVGIGYDSNEVIARTIAAINAKEAANAPH